MQLQARSQWSYARSRFFRHRLATDRPGSASCIIFGAGIFANFIAPYSYSVINLAYFLRGPTTSATTSWARTPSAATSSAA